MLEERVRLLLALNVLGGRRHVVEDGDEIKIGLARALIHVREDVIALDPAFGFLEFHVLSVLGGQKIRILAEMPIIDRYGAYIPEIAGLKR